MTVPVHVSNDRDYYVEHIHWEDVFQVLGLRRCQPLLRAAGVPAVMADAPEGLMRAAYYFWQRNWEHDPIDVGPHWTRETFTEEIYAEHLENYRLEIVSLVRDTFALLVNDYGEAATRELYDWAQRNFVDYMQMRRWKAWSRLMLGLVRESWFFYPLDPPPLAPAVLERVKETARAYEYLLCIDKDDDEPEAKLLAAARNIPLSTIEQRMVARKPVYPDDPLEADALLNLQFVLHQQAAYRLWQELDTWLEESDRQALLRWGSEQAAIIGELVEWITLPDRPAEED
jgi:hypothetical protein